MVLQKHYMKWCCISAIVRKIAKMETTINWCEKLLLKWNHKHGWGITKFDKT